jgi:hypothetical protein
MSTHTGAISPKIEQLRFVRRLAWRLVVILLLIHFAASAAHDLLFGDPGFLLVKVG